MSENITSSTVTSTESPASCLRRFIAHKLGSDSRWAERAITVLYGFQTEDEQVSNATKERNGAGFNGTDAFILSSFAEQIARGRTLSPKQQAIAFRKLPKYAGQIEGVTPTVAKEVLTSKAIVWAESNPPAPKKAKEEAKEEALA